MDQKTFTVVLDAFDGTQYGLLRVAVMADSKERAERDAIRDAEADGYAQVKLMFTL